MGECQKKSKILLRSAKQPEEIFIQSVETFYVMPDANWPGR